MVLHLHEQEAEDEGLDHEAHRDLEVNDGYHTRAGGVGVQVSEPDGGLRLHGEEESTCKAVQMLDAGFVSRFVGAATELAVHVAEQPVKDGEDQVTEQVDGQQNHQHVTPLQVH